jgi:site-specific recombinase XerD
VAILSRLELTRAATATPQITDEVDAWFAGHLAKRLVRAGFLTLGQLAERIRARGAWYSGITAIGKAKAVGIAQQLEQVLPGSTRRATRSELQVCEPGASTAHRADNIGGINSDRQALEDWVTAAAGSMATVKSYQREARRLMLWMQMERAGKGLATFRLDDAQAYRAFLAYIPEPWISRAKAAPGTEGWSPFRGQISAASQRQALTVVAAWFDWLVNAEYIRVNPWRLIKKSGQNRGEIVQALDTKAFSDKAMAEVISFIERQTPNPAQARARFVIAFLASTGIRSAELLSATVGDVRAEPEGMFLRVTGKGGKIRDVMLVDAAVAALNDYLATRGLDSIESAPAAAPLLAQQDDAMQPVGYMTLYKTTRQWLARAVTFSALSDAEKNKLQGASAHWLRHTFGTRAVAAGAPLDVIQQQLGHNNINTTMSIYSRAPLARRAAELQKAMGSSLV